MEPLLVASLQSMECSRFWLDDGDPYDRGLPNPMGGSAGAPIGQRLILGRSEFGSAQSQNSSADVKKMGVLPRGVGLEVIEKQTIFQ